MEQWKLGSFSKRRMGFARPVPEMKHGSSIVMTGSVTGERRPREACSVVRQRSARCADKRCKAFVTLHPSALLRIRDEAEKRRAYRSLVDDLRLVSEALEA
jgi:uracil-DNA glycosylase